MQSDTGNLFEGIPVDIDSELFTELCCGERVRIERIISRGHTSPASGWYDQSEHEWVVVLRGEAKIALENGETVFLGSGSYLNIPAHTKHKVVWTAPDMETVWLAVFYR